MLCFRSYILWLVSEINVKFYSLSTQFAPEPSHGSQELPDDIKTWLRKLTFQREIPLDKTVKCALQSMVQLTSPEDLTVVKKAMERFILFMKCLYKRVPRDHTLIITNGDAVEFIGSEIRAVNDAIQNYKSGLDYMTKILPTLWLGPGSPTENAMAALQSFAVLKYMKYDDTNDSLQAVNFAIGSCSAFGDEASITASMNDAAQPKKPDKPIQIMFNAFRKVLQETTIKGFKREPNQPVPNKPFSFVSGDHTTTAGPITGSTLNIPTGNLNPGPENEVSEVLHGKVIWFVEMSIIE